MPTPILADKIEETSLSIGTGNITLGGAVTGKLRTFASGLAIGSLVCYSIDHQGGSTNEWEVGYGTLIDATTIRRDTVSSSTNGGALVNFSAGLKYVSETISADLLTQLLSGSIALSRLPLITIAKGGSGADLSATSGLLRQPTPGAAFTATQLQSADVPNSLIANAMLATDAVTQAKILDGSVTTSKINDVAVTSAKIATDAVTTAKIAALAVTDAKINDMVATKLTGDIAIARMQVALAAGGVPIKATTFESTSDAMFGPAGAALGDARVVVNQAASGKGTINRANATTPGNIEEWQKSTGSAYWTMGGTGILTLNNLNSDSYSLILNDQNGFAAVKFNVLGGNSAGHLLLNAPTAQGNGAGLDFTANGGTVTALFQLDGSGNLVFRQGSAGSMFYDYNNGVNFRRISDFSTMMALNTTGLLTVTARDTATNSIPNALVLAHTTSATPIAGLGVGILGQLKSSSTNNRSASLIETKWFDSTDAAAIPDVNIVAYHNASGTLTRRVGFTVRGGASATLWAIAGGTVAATATVTGSRGGNAALADLITKLADKGIIVDGSSA